MSLREALQTTTTQCSVCDTIILIKSIKYHTADHLKIFCGPECSLQHHKQESKTS